MRQRRPRAFAKCVARLDRLIELGFELRRPEADMLRDGIYELRAREGRVNYRILYFFHGQNVAILASALTKEDRIPKVELDRAIQRKAALEANPRVHIHYQEIPDA